jgi:hypothetical protein
LDQALAIFTSFKEAVPMDRIKLVTIRAILHARRGKWSESEQISGTRFCWLAANPP